MVSALFPVVEGTAINLREASELATVGGDETVLAVETKTPCVRSHAESPPATDATYWLQQGLRVLDMSGHARPVLAVPDTPDDQVQLIESHSRNRRS
jgi:hypothetical protein